MSFGVTSSSKDPIESRLVTLEREIQSLRAQLRQIPSRFPAGGSADGASIRETITVANTFAAGDVVYRNGSTWSKAQANAAASSAKYTGVIESATSTSFVLVYAGKITLAAATLTPGTTYYLSDATAGLTVVVGSLTANQLTIPVYRAITATTAIVMSARDVGCDLSTLTAGDVGAGGGSLRLNIDATHSFAAGPSGLRYDFTATSSFVLSQYGQILLSSPTSSLSLEPTAKVVMTYPNSNTVTLETADFVGTGKIVKLREITICSEVDGTNKKILVLCSQEY